jgi:hypothetical protein
LSITVFTLKISCTQTITVVLPIYRGWRNSQSAGNIAGHGLRSAHLPPVVILLPLNALVGFTICPLRAGADVVDINIDGG